MENISDTITAIATGTGGAIAVIRISGSDALRVSSSFWRGHEKLSRENRRIMLLGKCTSPDGLFAEQAIAVYFPAPNSYTGEDIVEIQCHGGTLVSRKVLELCLRAGARQANPGEFTFRAFMNGKIDLTQAEGVAEIISAQSSMALNLAERQAGGIIGKTVREIRNSLIFVLSECESRLDFGEENLDWTSPDDLKGRLNESSGKITGLLKYKTEGAVLREGIRIVIAGKPNVGKSSMLNLLLGYDRAIVTPLPGTTRDTVEEHAVIRDIPVRLIDTAGIRDADDLIENKGIERSLASLKQAQLVLWILDPCSELQSEIETMKTHVRNRDSSIAVWNKTDLVKDPSLLPDTGIDTVKVSAEKNKGIEKLLDAIEKKAWGHPHTEEPELAVSSRHSALLEDAAKAIPEAVSTITSRNWELAAVHLRSAVFSLGKITGEDASFDILDDIFSRFCIGK
ncbi:MAG: tRNA uridine-5-carboxymethylaminomethyl(34) synthesis GTPase MnmE [Victivallales bacterium]|jgi:tRNA modification GTPase